MAASARSIFRIEGCGRLANIPEKATLRAAVKETKPQKQATQAPTAYEPPLILWETQFIALMQVTQPTCHPFDPPPCPS
jgi:hypothetical protein